MELLHDFRGIGVMTVWSVGRGCMCSTY